MSYKGIFKDDSDDFESESGEDFSASEDEWKPGKDDAVSDEDDDNVANESGDDVSDDDGGRGKNNKSKNSRSKGGKKVKAPKLSAASTSKHRPPTTSLRSKLFRRYNPPPKTVSKSPIPAKVSDILSNSQYKSNKSLMQPSKDKVSSARAVFSDSESSDDDGLVDPNEIDYSSQFFNVKKVANRSNEPESSSVPTFDCNAGVKLSDSSDGDDDDNEFTEVAAAAADTGSPKKPSIINQINSKSGHEMHDFSSLQSFAKNLESAKAQMEKLKAKEAQASTSKFNADESDITKLLSLGEGTALATKSPSSRKRKHKDGQQSDDSEWENVSDNDEHANEIKDIQITVGNTAVRQLTRDQKKAIDVEACLKRRLNREIKLKQVILHKASVLCWLAHGNYINRVLNNMTLMEMCIKLLPSKNAYPKGDTDVKYYHMVTEWFHSIFQLKSDKLYCPLKKLPSKTVSLALQIQSKKIISKCDFVLLFVTMLRSLGIQCRMVINFSVPPQQPPQKDLFHISTKPKDAVDDKKATEKEIKKESTTKKTKESTLAKKIKMSMENVKKSNTNERLSTSASATNSPSKKIPKLEKLPESKANTSTKSKNNSMNDATDHSYAEKVKVKLSRMSESFVADKTKLPTAKPSELKPSQSPSTKVKQLKDSEHPAPSTSPRVNGKAAKTKNIGNADAATSASQNSPKKSSTKQSQTLTGTPIKIKLAERTNGNDVAMPFSPRKTRSKVGKLSTNMLPQSQDSIDSIDKKKAKVPKKLNVDTLNINVAALLPGAKPAKPAKANMNGSDEPTATERLVDVNRNRAKNVSRRPPTRTGLKRQYQDSLDNEASGEGLKKIKLPQLDGAHDTAGDKKSKAKAKTTKAKPRPKATDDANSDSDFEPAPTKRIRPKVTPPPKKPANKLVARAKKIDNRVFSTDEEDVFEVVNTTKMNFWVEAYAEQEKKWITIDPVHKKVDNVDYVRKHSSKPLIYVFAWNNDNTIRDVTPRYCSHFHTTTRKLRAEQLWIDDALAPYIEHRNPRTIIEDVEFSKLQMDTPLPTSISEFKNHPLYALERHLLKFEGIYPPNALTLGYIRNEPVYSRDCVHTLHSREIWVKQARTVKIGEKPYKIVKARPKWNRMLNQMEEAKPLEIFGFWQTEPYKPPVAENGIVPRNPYGNVELFKPEMLPIGTRHLQLPNLNRVCKKMGVDCAQAVIGFDFHGGSSHPTFDGFVVCEEFADDVIKQWEIEQEEQARKETEKREVRVYGNWKKLIKGLLIRERLKRKFNFGADDSKEKEKGKRKKETH